MTLYLRLASRAGDWQARTNLSQLKDAIAFGQLEQALIQGSMPCRGADREHLQLRSAAFPVPRLPPKSPQLVDPEFRQMASDAAFLYRVTRFKEGEAAMSAG